MEKKRTNECFVSTQNASKHLGGWFECVFRPCYKCKKHTKPPPWSIDLNLCPASWLRVTAGLLLMPPYTPASFIASGMA